MRQLVISLVTAVSLAFYVDASNSLCLFSNFVSRAVAAVQAVLAGASLASTLAIIGAFNASNSV